MELATALIAVVILGADGLALAWVVRRLPPGWKGVGLGFAAIAGALLVAFAGWFVAAESTTSARFLCIECGQMEQRTSILRIAVFSAPLADGGAYAQTFAPQLAKEHEHDWRVQGCIQTFRGVSCTEQYQASWFRLLPKLIDRGAAEALVREARAMPVEERMGLMSSFDESVAFPAEYQHENLDEAFAKWRAERK